jgi:hypothetical protein
MASVVMVPLVFVLFAAACGSGSSPAPTAPSPSTTELTGTVRGSATGARIAGARIRVLNGPASGRETTTNAEGDYRLSLPLGGLPNTFSLFSASAERHDESLININYTVTERLDFTLRSRVVFTGLVVEIQTGARIAGATVRQLDGAGNDTGRRTTTNSEGVFRFEDVPAGTSNFGVTAEGYLEARGGTNVNGINTLVFELRRRP